MTGLGEAREVFDDAIEIGLLHDDTSHTALSKAGLHIVETRRAIPDGQHLESDVLMEGIGLKHLEGVGIQTARHQHLALLLTGSDSHHHRLCAGGRTVVHRGIGDVHTREFGHHTLIFEDIVERAL